MPAQNEKPNRTAGDVMTDHPACCTPETPLARVAQLMVLQDCGEIPVIESEETRIPVGVVTDRDIVCRLVAKGINPLDHTAAMCMSSPPITVSEETPLDVVISTMERHQIRRVPVVNPRGACIGMIAQADLAWAESNKDVAELVREVSRDSLDPSR